MHHLGSRVICIIQSMGFLLLFYLLMKQVCFCNFTDAPMFFSGCFLTTFGTGVNDTKYYHRTNDNCKGSMGYVSGNSIRFRNIDLFLDYSISITTDYIKKKRYSVWKSLLDVQFFYVPVCSNTFCWLIPSIPWFRTCDGSS